MVTSTVDLTGIVKRINGRLTDENKTSIVSYFATLCTPYVPMDTGTLEQTRDVTPDYVEYTSKYAHYMYTGDVYGPNIPIFQNGIIVGWFSQKDVKKKPTGKSINYTQKHSLATKEWDKAAMSAQMPALESYIADILSGG